MAGSDPDLVVRVAANIQALQTDMAAAAASIKTIEAASTTAATASAGWTSALNDLGHSFVARIAEGMLLRDAMREFIHFGEEVLTAGADIKKMAEQTSLSTDEVQRLSYIAGQTNTSITSLVGAVQNLQVRLGDETTGAAGAMAKLRINTETFTKLGAYEQMVTLSTGIQAIQDPTEQASVAAALFGKTWKEILPAIKSGMEEVGDQAPIMAESSVESLAKIEEALKGARAQAITWGGGFVLAINNAGFAFGDFLSRFNPDHLGIATSEILKLQGALNDPSGLLGALNSIKPAAVDVGAGVKDLTLKGLDLIKVQDQLALNLLVAKQALKDEAEAAKILELQYVELSKVTAEYYKAVNAASHDTVGREVDDVYVAAQAKVDAMQKTKGYSIAAEMEVWATADQVANNIIQKTLESDRYSSAHYTKLADEARIAYDFALDHASNFTTQEIQLFHDAYLSAEQASNHWSAAASADMDQAATRAPKVAQAIGTITQAVQTLAGEWIKAADAKARFDQGNTLDVGHAAQDPEIMALLKEGWSLANAEQIKLSHQWNFLPKLFDPLGNPETTPSKGERVPGYLVGGPVPETGPALLHGGEYVVPKDGTLVSSGGSSPIINVYVTQPLGTPLQIAAAVGPAIVTSLKSLGFRFQAGT